MTMRLKAPDCSASPTTAAVAILMRVTLVKIPHSMSAATTVPASAFITMAGGKPKPACKVRLANTQPPKMICAARRISLNRLIAASSSSGAILICGASGAKARLAITMASQPCVTPDS